MAEYGSSALITISEGTDFIGWIIAIIAILITVCLHMLSKKRLEERDKENAVNTKELEEQMTELLDKSKAETEKIKEKMTELLEKIDGIGIEERTISLKEVLDGVYDKSREIAREFKPEVIYAPGVRSSIVAFLMEKYLCKRLGRHITIIFGNCFFKKDFKNKKIGIYSFYYRETKKWHMYIPEHFHGLNDKRVLIVDDFYDTGNSLEILKNFLIEEFEFPKENIKTFCLITKRPKEEPLDYYWKEFKRNESPILPWGELR